MPAGPGHGAARPDVDVSPVINLACWNASDPQGPLGRTREGKLRSEGAGSLRSGLARLLSEASPRPLAPLPVPPLGLQWPAECPHSWSQARPGRLSDSWTGLGNPSRSGRPATRVGSGFRPGEGTRCSRRPVRSSLPGAPPAACRSSVTYVTRKPQWGSTWRQRGFRLPPREVGRNSGSFGHHCPGTGPAKREKSRGRCNASLPPSKTR